MKNTLAVFLSLLFVLTATGCHAQKSESGSVSYPSSSVSDENPFQPQTSDAAGVLGSIGHEPVNLTRDKNGDILPFVYTGTEMKIDYKVNASGKAKNVGFLVFVDGVSQPYKTDKESAYQTMHVLNLEENDKDYPFSILFDPLTGTKGQTLALTIVSVYAPDFMPDMVTTSSYGGYHDTLANNYEIRFDQDANLPDSSALPNYVKLHHVKQSTVPITQDYINSLSVFSGMQAINLEMLNKQVFAQQFFNGQGGLISNLKIDATGTLHLTFKLTGYPGARYRTTFYLDHQALADDATTSFETALTKGNVEVIEAEIDLSALKEFNTFYVISTLCNYRQLWEDGTPLIKTSSVLLYKN